MNVPELRGVSEVQHYASDTSKYFDKYAYVRGDPVTVFHLSGLSNPALNGEYKLDDSQGMILDEPTWRGQNTFGANAAHGGGQYYYIARASYTTWKIYRDSVDKSQ